jgi:hypothetical protein
VAKRQSKAVEPKDEDDFEDSVCARCFYEQGNGISSVDTFRPSDAAGEEPNFKSAAACWVADCAEEGDGLLGLFGVSPSAPVNRDIS